MANITTYLENKLLEHATGKTSWTMPTATYAALFTVTPTTSYTSALTNGTEVTSGNGYTRFNLTSNWATAANGVISNSTALSWTATGTWPSGGSSAASVTTIGIFDSGTVNQGNLLWFGPLSAPITMVNGDTFTIPVGNLTIAIS
jgi:hypothetical protein